MVLLPAPYFPSAGPTFGILTLLVLSVYALLLPYGIGVLENPPRAWIGEIWMSLFDWEIQGQPESAEDTAFEGDGSEELALLKVEMTNFLEEMLATTMVQGDPELGRSNNPGFEGYRDTGNDSHQKTLAIANMQATKTEHTSKEAQVLMLTQANQDLEAAKQQQEEKFANELEDFRIQSSFTISNQADEIKRLTSDLRALKAKSISDEVEATTHTTNIRALENKCKSNESEIRRLAQARDDLKVTNKGLEEKILGLVDRISEYKTRLVEALANVSAATTTFPVVSPLLFSAQHVDCHTTAWRPQTQSADSSPWYLPPPNVDRYDRRYAMPSSRVSEKSNGSTVVTIGPQDTPSSSMLPLPQPPFSQLTTLSPLVASHLDPTDYFMSTSQKQMPSIDYLGREIRGTPTGRDSKSLPVVLTEYTVRPGTVIELPHCVHSVS